MGPQNYFNTFAPDCITGRYNITVLGISISTRLLTQPADSSGWADFLRDHEFELSRVISEKFGYDPNLNNPQIIQFFLHHAEVAHLYAIGTRARNIYTSLRLAGPDSFAVEGWWRWSNFLFHRADFFRWCLNLPPSEFLLLLTDSQYCYPICPEIYIPVRNPYIALDLRHRVGGLPDPS